MVLASSERVGGFWRFSSRYFRACIKPFLVTLAGAILLFSLDPLVVGLGL